MSTTYKLNVASRYFDLEQRIQSHTTKTHMFKDDPPVVAVELGRLQPVELRVRPEVKRQDVLLK